MAKSKRNILNKNSAFNVMVNMYITRYIYSHIDKASVFMDEYAKRKKSIDFHAEVVGISRPRMGRILHGENFEMSSVDRERLSSMFGISEKYYEGGNSIMEIHLLQEMDWKCFFNEYFYTDFEIELPERVKDDSVLKVEQALNRLKKKGVIENEYDTDSPIYRVSYYFRNGVTYKEESRLTRFLKSLSDLQLSDWEEIEGDIEKLKYSSELLAKHNDYVNVVTRYKELKEK